LIAADRGFSAEEIAERLMSLSEKARQKKKAGRRYAGMTVTKAAERVRARKADR
jgi:hypothetical protein